MKSLFPDGLTYYMKQADFSGRGTGLYWICSVPPYFTEDQANYFLNCNPLQELPLAKESCLT